MKVPALLLLGSEDRIIDNPRTLAFVSRFDTATTIIEYDRAALRQVAEQVGVLSDAEALPAHGDAVRARFRGEQR